MKRVEMNIAGWRCMIEESRSSMADLMYCTLVKSNVF